MLQEASRASSGAQARSFTCSQQTCWGLHSHAAGRGQGQRPGDVLADESINLAHVPMWVHKLA